MFDFDLTSWAGISASIMILVSLLKWGIPKWVTNREPILSMGLGVVLGIASLLSHAMIFKGGAAGWVQAVAGGLSAGLLAQIGHDKALNPLKQLFWKGGNDVGAQPAPPAPPEK